MSLVINDPLLKAVHDMPQQYRNTARAVVAEVFDPDYMAHQHGRRATRNRGCTGPLCGKALRDWGRERAQTRARMLGVPEKHSSRTLVYIEADRQLDKLQTAYDETHLSWKIQELDPVHTALLLNHVMSDWSPVPWDSIPQPIRQYAAERGLAGSALRRTA